LLKITMKAARVNAGLTLDQAAKKIGVTKMTLINWEKGRTAPKPADFEYLCKIYQMPRDYIFLPGDLT